MVHRREARSARGSRDKPSSQRLHVDKRPLGVQDRMLLVRLDRRLDQHRDTVLAMTSGRRFEALRSLEGGPAEVAQCLVAS